jgi:hypothetical protein
MITVVELPEYIRKSERLLNEERKRTGSGDLFSIVFEERKRDKRTGSGDLFSIVLKKEKGTGKIKNF